MAFIFVDSFEAYASSADLADRGWTVTGTPTLDTSTFKDNSRSLQVDGGDRVEQNLGNGAGPTVSFLSVWLRFDYTPGVVQRVLSFLQDTAENISLRLTTARRLQFYNAAGAALGSASSALSTNTWYHLEIKVTYSDSITLGDVELYIDGVQEIQLPATTDTDNAGSSTVDGFQLRSSTAVGENHYFDSIVWWSSESGDTWTDLKGIMRIETLYAEANGPTSDFDGSDGNSVNNYQLIDEGPGHHDGNTTYVQSETPNDTDLYGFASMTAIDIESIEGVNVVIVAQKTDVATRSIRAVVNLEGSETTGDTHALTELSYLAFVSMFDQIAGSEWTESDVNSAYYGIEVVA